MGFVDRLKRLFKRSKAIEALESPQPSESENSKEKRVEAIEKTEALESPIESIKSLEALQALESPITSKQEEAKKDSETIELQKESIKFGLAAGYFGRSIREIENTLSKLESDLPNKEWIISKLDEKFERLESILKDHDSRTSILLSQIYSMLMDIKGVAEKAPEPIKTQLLTRIEAAKTKILTPRMKDAINIIKDRKEISYEDLAREMGISVSALRGLLSLIVARYPYIERFTRNGKGWVKILSD